MKRNPFDERLIEYYQSKSIPVRNAVWEQLERRLKYQRKKRQCFRVAAVVTGLFFFTQIYTEQPFTKQQIEGLNVAAIKTIAPQPFETAPIASTGRLKRSNTQKQPLRSPVKILGTTPYHYEEYRPIDALTIEVFSAFAIQLDQDNMLSDEASRLLAQVERVLQEEELEQEALALRIQIENQLAFEKTIRGNLKKIINSFSSANRVVLKN